MQPGGETAFGRIMERGRAGQGGGESGLDHRDPRHVEGGSSRREHRRGNRGEAFRRQDAGEHRRALHRCGSYLEDGVARTEPPGRHGPLRRDSKHLPDHERLAYRARHLGVSPHESCSYLVERAPHLREERLRIVARRSFGQQHAREKPSRTRSGHRDVVRIDRDRVCPHPGAGEGDGVRRRHQRSRLDLDRARIFADARSKHDFGRK